MKRQSALTSKLPIGNLDRKVVFVAISETQSNTGHPYESLEDVYEDFAAIEYGSGQSGGGEESYEADRQISMTTVKFWVRSSIISRTITTKHRLRIKETGEVYDIEGITDPEGRRRFLRFQCTLRN